MSEGLKRAISAPGDTQKSLLFGGAARNPSCAKAANEEKTSIVKTKDFFTL
jgi:hypothetical protein